MSKLINFVRTGLLAPEINKVGLEIELLNDPIIIDNDTWHISGLYRSMFKGLFLSGEVKELKPLIDRGNTEMRLPSGHINSIWISESSSMNNADITISFSLNKPKNDIKSYQLYNLGHEWTFVDPRQDTIVYIVKLKVNYLHYSLQTALAEGADILFCDNYSETDSQDICNLLNKNKNPGDEIYIPVYRTVDIEKEAT